MLDAHVSEYVREILTAGPEAVMAAKALIREIWGRSPADADSHDRERHREAARLR